MSLNLNDYDAVIFDMDGVLIDSEPLWKIAMHTVFSSLGSSLTKVDFQRTVGLRLDEVVRYWYQHEAWKNVSPDHIEKEIIAQMQLLIKEHGKPLNGVLETVQFLRKSSLKLGIATSSYAVLMDSVLDILQLKKQFHFTHSAENELYGKPHPAVYLTTASKLNVLPNRCLVIEDSLNGIISAKAARMNVVCIPEKTHAVEPRLVLADYHFEDMLGLLKVLMN
jgi:HAD superfamily hydrolase (TIGR01509 family)